MNTHPILIIKNLHKSLSFPIYNKLHLLIKPLINSFKSRMGNTIGIGGGSKRTTKIMNTKGETTKLKTPIKAMEITKDHPGHVLLESESVRHFGIRAKPLDPTQFLEPKRVYFLVELPKFPVDHDREPRRVRSGGIHMGAKERLESLVLSKRSISDLSIMKPSGSVVVDEAADGAAGGAVRVKLRLPKAEVERLMKESKNKTEAAEKIMDLYMGSSCSETGSDTVSVSGSEKSGFGSPEHVPHLRRQVRRGKSPLSGVPEGYKKRVSFMPTSGPESQLVLAS